MARPAQDGEHGTYKRYKQGCRGDDGCQPCKDAAADYVKDYRARKRGLAEPAVAVVAPSAPGGAVQRGPRATVTALNKPDGPGPAERAVIEDTAGLSTASSNRALVEGALAMARILDDYRQVTTHPSALRQLSAAMAELKRGAEKKQGRLAAVQAMSQRDAG